jgi:hypothetical protein
MDTEGGLERGDALGQLGELRLDVHDSIIDHRRGERVALARPRSSAGDRLRR